ncbi:MAG: glycerophosphodiester phosphodiesterase [Pseudomonadota bacterium]
MNASDFPYLQHDGFIAMAHRGGAGEWPENTMPAFENAVALGYRYIETDVHTTRDGALIAFHDDRLDRVSNKNGRINELALIDVRAARIDGSERVPEMAEVLQSWPQIKFNIEPKDDAAVEPLCRLIKESNAIDRVCVGSFSGARIARAREILGPQLCTSMGPYDVARLRLAALGVPVGSFDAACAQVAPTHYGIPAASKAMVEAAHDRGMQLHVWTIDDPQEMRLFIDRGVDALMTDEPAILKSVLQSRDLW